MVRPEFLPYFFDKSERLQAIADLLDKAGISKDGRILDVGGHPGLLASALEGRYEVVTADFPPTGRVPYLRASGSALPFRSQTFEAVVASDTLEHVPPQAREVFLSELWRVCSGIVLVGGPYATRGTAFAEARLRELEAMVRATPDRWLTEHAEHGLPGLADTCAAFARRGAQVSVLPGGSLLRWFTLFAGKTVLEELPGGSEVLDSFMPDYNALFSESAPDMAPAYRHLVIAARDRQLWQTGFEPGPKQFSALEWEPPGPDQNLDRRIDAVFKFFSGLAQALRLQARRTEAGGGLDQAYIAQLEAALRQQNERLQQLELERRPSMLSRLLRRAQNRRTAR